jgi:hypothetical protein
MSDQKKTACYIAALEKRVAAYELLDQSITIGQLIDTLTVLGCVKAAGALIEARRILYIEMENEVQDLKALQTGGNKDGSV